MKTALAKKGLILPATLALVALGTVAIAATAERLARLNVEETQLSVEQSRNMGQLARLLTVLEELKRHPPPALLVSPRDAKDAVRAAILVKAMTPELQIRALGYAHEAGEMMRQRRLAAVESEALFTNESERAEASPPPEGPPVLRGPLSAGAPGAPQAAITPPQSLSIPTPGPIVRRFGQALASGGRSNGVTFAAAGGARVASPGPGYVQYVGPVKGWGVILILRLAGGYHLVLAGLDRTTVAVGQSVAAGEAVGFMPDARQSPDRGANDKKASQELYLEVREQGAPVDPGRWLNKAG
ncbi:MAG TPA: peptidoglycan DD-metalloendopeptidase family protein [Phenylobacterium sp.]|jgi:septal ring factor EnvC (AmiA/AmiB activator)|uniref:murein hydrolase activator EnvC family protein n=1 Tax=Phenylobacterium sp. TaxID=1871053 RepID=UPI002D37B265|nr:peptidoglycan DD-metalloendopeptidase family protein [Phenylobacterium sp.]HZZ69261.1 peptidoglycan DD-metalloendopeptidase family protein [Phenylobacterium sp.]